ncbi:uncharacterized protein BDW47DRAFT_104060 [Aspergillus candidus]|uniref:Uncharacterized protein n=1 Tax=Aspergillus candidus TaxID=41067 RepID=A0A2I2FEG9_ASPCN|nr:hypothetical protein BDW47DRAFT_104060 [Aspergillus candidus]PLB38989.1 hypothetical protein BDW47DRAFT_104060 [Aspergillus candidus]
MVKKYLTSHGKSFILRYSPQTLIPPVAQRYLDLPVHPLRPKIQHMYDNRDPETLWWRVSLHQFGQYKRVVRSWTARRARVAFREALKQHGFDEAGKRLEPGTTGYGCMDSPNGGLKGSLEVIVRLESIDEPFAEVQSDMHSSFDQLVDKTRVLGSQGVTSSTPARKTGLWQPKWSGKTNNNGQ